MAAWMWIGFTGARADFTDWIDQAGSRLSIWPSRDQRSARLMAERRKRGRRYRFGFSTGGRIGTLEVR